MAALPQCPNFREKHCDRSELILLGEDEKYFRFHCKCCMLLWAVSKDKTKQQAREANRVKRLQDLHEKERERMRRSVFYAPSKGWANV